jgi:hypothetical protein
MRQQQARPLLDSLESWLRILAATSHIKKLL